MGVVGKTLLGMETVALQMILQRLRTTEQKVKAHEMAHKVAAGELGGPPKYKYKKGPDGKLYITGGEVPLRVRKGKNPEETIEIARKLRRAALAPMDPSPQDRAVAAKAIAIELQAKMELQQQSSTLTNSEKNQRDTTTVDIYV